MKPNKIPCTCGGVAKYQHLRSVMFKELRYYCKKCGCNSIFKNEQIRDKFVQDVLAGKDVHARNYTI